MKKHTEVKVLVQMGSGKRFEVTGYKTYSPYFAVTPRVHSENQIDAKQFCITHIQTGAAVAHYLPKTRAFKIAAAMGALMNWDGEIPSVLASRFTCLPQSFQRWARGFSF